MRNWIIIGIFSCLLIIVSCTKSDKSISFEEGKAVITGRIQNLGNDSKAIRFASGSTVKSIENTALIDSAGNFRLEIALYHPQNIQGFFKKGFIQIYIRPSDSIHLDIDETLFSREKLPYYRISGTSPDAEISQEIQSFLKYCGENEFSPDAKGKSVKEFLQILKTQINYRDSILQRFSKENESSIEFIEWAEKDTKYSIANYLLDYKFTNPNYKGKLFDKSIFPIDDDAAIVTSSYPLHLRHYALDIGIWQDSVTLYHLKANNYVEAYQRCLETIIDSVGNGLSRDIMCYQLLFDMLSESYKDYKIVSQDKDRYLANETFKKALLEKEHDYENQDKMDISFLDSETDKAKKIKGDFWSKLKEEHQGKVMYVDIWATWCGPCRGEIPHAIELHDYFDSNDIAFINLCLASNENEWKKMIKSNNIKGHNYYFNRFQTQILRDKLQFEGYPTYLIIDKQGNIVNKNAPRPSSGKKIRQELNNWIEKDTP